MFKKTTYTFSLCIESETFIIYFEILKKFGKITKLKLNGDGKN